MKINSDRLKLVILFSIGVVLLMFFAWSGFVFSQNPGTDFIICTAVVNQPSCYDVGSVTPRLNWTYTSSVFGQAAFWIQVDDNSDFSSLVVNTNWITSSNTFYDIPAGPLNNNTTYYWRIKGEDTNGSQGPWTNADAPFVTPSSSCPQYSFYTNVASATSHICPPDSLIATTISCSQIDISWNDNSNAESGYKIERKTGPGGSWSQIDTVGANLTTYSDVSVADNSEYYYRVRAYTATDNSGYSNEDNDTTLYCPPDGDPSNLSAVAVACTQVDLSWQDNSSDEDGYKIERKTGPGGVWAEIDTVGANVENYSDNNVFENTQYSYRVRAYRFGIYSSYSNEVSITLPFCPPTASDLDVVKGDYCSAPTHYFSWIYSDMDSDDESQFQFQVDNNSGFGSPEVNQTQSGLSNPSPSPNNQAVSVVVAPGPNQIGYNTTYYWRVKVWDSDAADSGWIEGPSFTTEKHQYPSVDFNWSPKEPSQGENVLFADQSTVYGGATKSAWAWTIPGANYVSGNSSSQNPTVQFTSTGDRQVTLRVTDSDGCSCQASTKTVGVQMKLPGWKEILPW